MGEYYENFDCFIASLFFLRYTSTDLKKNLKLILISNLIYENLILNLGQSIFLLVSSFKSQVFSHPTSLAF